MLRLLWIALGTLVFGYVALALAAFGFQRSLLFQPPAEPRSPPAEQGELLRLDSFVATWRPPEAGGLVVVCFHGNAEQLADLSGLVKELHAAGLGVLAVEFPGYGLASGAPSRASIQRAAAAALAHLRGPMAIPPARTILFGQSLGTGIATELAAQGAGASLVLVSPYTSIADMAAIVAPMLPNRLLVRDPFDTAALAPSIRIPTLIVHGTQDEVIPAAMGERLAKLFPRVRLELVAGAGHNDILASLPRGFWRRLASMGP